MSTITLLALLTYTFRNLTLLGEHAPPRKPERETNMSPIIILCLILSIAAFTPLAIGHDGSPDPRRIVYVRHHSYILGMQAAVFSVGAKPYDQMLLNDFYDRWNAASNGFREDYNTYKKSSEEEVPSEVVLRIYTKYLKENGIQCGHALWIDTFTNEHCK